MRAYGGIPIGGRNARGGLAAWQLQRARDFINVNLERDPSIAEIAHECGLSSGYLRVRSNDQRAFRLTSG